MYIFIYIFTRFISSENITLYILLCFYVFTSETLLFQKKTTFYLINVFLYLNGVICVPIFHYFVYNKWCYMYSYIYYFEYNK